MSAPRFPFPLIIAVVLAAAAPVGASDDSYRDAQGDLREAVRDTAGHAADAGRLDALGAALLKLDRFGDAEKVFRRALAVSPSDGVALAGLGKMALFQQREAEAESLLVLAGEAEGASRDLYFTRLRRGEWAAAAAMAEGQDEEGRKAMLEKLAEAPPFELAPGPDHATLFLERLWPVPLVRVKLNGQFVLMAIDLGAPELLLDPSAMRTSRAQPVAGERSILWNGGRVATKAALVQKLEFGGLVLTNVPAAVMPLHRYGLEVNPQGVTIAGVIGLPVLQRFGVTIDFEKQRFELRRPGPGYTASGTRVPLETWGEHELTVHGSLNGGRRMAILVSTGLPGAGVGAPAEVFDELGIKPGKIANLVRGAGTFLQGAPWSQVSVQTVALGSVVQDHVIGWSGALDASELWRHGVRRDAILGPAFFRGRRVTFDWDRHEMVFEGD